MIWDSNLEAVSFAYNVTFLKSKVCDGAIGQAKHVCTPRIIPECRDAGLIRRCIRGYSASMLELGNEHRPFCSCRFMYQEPRDMPIVASNNNNDNNNVPGIVLKMIQ